MGWQPEELTNQIDGSISLFDTQFERRLGQLIVFYESSGNSGLEALDSGQWTEPNGQQIQLGFTPQPGDRLLAMYLTDETFSGRVAGSTTDPTAVGVQPLPQPLQDFLEQLEARIDALEGASAPGSLPPFKGVDGAVLMERPLNVASWQCLTETEVGPAFTASLSGNQTVEVGATIVNPQVSATYNDTTTTAAITDTEGNPALDVQGLPNPITVPYSYAKTGNNDQVSLNLNATRGTASDSGQVNLRWQPRVYWGSGAAGQNTELFLEALSNSALDSNRQRTIDSWNAAPGEKLYYAYPVSYGLATFQFGAFTGGFLTPTTISATNSFGVTQDYYLYESQASGLGSPSVGVL